MSIFSSNVAEQNYIYSFYLISFEGKYISINNKNVELKLVLKMKERIAYIDAIF